MRTLILIAIGLAAIALLMWRTPPSRRTLALWPFTIAWLMVTAWNLRTGLSHGYTLGDELPIHLILFGVPVLAAWAWLWRRRRVGDRVNR